MTKKYKGLPSPIGWVGGKSRLANSINEIIKTIPHTTFVEPFAGSGAVYFKKKPADNEILNDINPSLTHFYKQLKGGIDLKNCKTNINKEEFKKAQKKIKNGNGSMCDFLKVNKNSFAMNMNNYTTYKCAFKDPSCGIKKIINNKEEYDDRLKNTRITNKDYRDIVRETDSQQTLYYIDPPYTKSSKSYKTDLTQVTPEKVANTFKNIKGKAIISFDDNSKVRNAFKGKGYKFLPIETKYSLNSKSKNRRGNKELIITNFDHKCKVINGKIQCPKNSKES